MAFVWKAPQRLRSPEQVARELLEVAHARRLDDFAAVLAVMCVAQESDFWCPANEKDSSSKDYPHDALSNDGRSVGYFQQQNGRAGDTLPPGDRDDWWGPMASRMDLRRSADVFYDRLEDNYRDAINDPLRAARFIQNVQRSYWNGRPDHPGYYGKHWDRAWQLVRAASSNTPPAEVKPLLTGDPVWLEDVLRPALGDRLKTLPGWQNSGHGDFGELRGVMVHHTGNSRESAQSIRNGRPDLKGPLSNLHIAPDGTVTIVAVGVCWHAGRGSYPWLPANNANQHMIGIECAWPTPRPDLPKGYDPAERWPDAQIIAMRDTCAALALKLGVPATRVIGHKEWAGAAQGKWDPGNLDMGWFRAEVAKDMRGEFDPKSPPPAQPAPVLPPDYAKETWDQLRIRWPMLGGQTLVEAVAEIRDKVCGTGDKEKR